jgi:hypothetical protein
MAIQILEYSFAFTWQWLYQAFSSIPASAVEMVSNWHYVLGNNNLELERQHCKTKDE